MAQLFEGYSLLTLALLALCLAGFVGVMASFYVGWWTRKRAAHQRRTGHYDDEAHLQPGRPR